ncbi:MAG: hypothetical protein EXR27_21265 [Betaproteobacteria bacterium]|nr:hypothetical protein [Betaproteobacteria bacterium]
MGRPVEFVFGLGSRYSYLASTQLDAIAARRGCEITWVPVSSVALMAAGGRTPFGGGPTFLAGKRMFWSNDRLGLLERCLRASP